MLHSTLSKGGLTGWDHTVFAGVFYVLVIYKYLSAVWMRFPQEGAGVIPWDGWICKTGRIWENLDA